MNVAAVPGILYGFSSQQPLMCVHLLKCSTDLTCEILYSCWVWVILCGVDYLAITYGQC
jgi:hypothetical protein